MGWRGDWAFWAVLALLLGLWLIPVQAQQERSGSLGADESAMLLSQVNQLDQAGKYAEAIPLAERYAQAIEARHGPESPEYTLALSTLGNLLRTTNRLTEAERLYRRALAIDEKSLGPEHPNVARDANNLALVLHATNRLADAEPLMLRALAIVEKSLGADHPNVATTLNNLAQLLQDTNRLAEAEPLMLRALAIDEKTLGPDHPNVAVRLNNLAELFQVTNRPAEAEPLYRRNIGILAKSLGAEHPNFALALNNLALLLKATNRLAEAEHLIRRALAINEKSLGPDHPNVALGLINLASLLQATNHLADAEPLIRRALAINEKSLGPEHPTVATSLGYLASLLKATNRLTEAEPLMRRALTIDEKSLGHENPSVARDLDNLAQLLQVAGRVAEAEPLMRRAIAVYENSFGRDHPYVAIVLSNLAALLAVTNQLAEAEPLIKRALAIDEKSLGPNHPHVAIRLNNLAELLRVTNRLAEAEPLMRRALAIYEKSLGPDHPAVANSLNNIALLLAYRDDWAAAATVGRRAKPILIGRGDAEVGDRNGLGNAVLASNTAAFRAHARAIYRAEAESDASRDEGFELAQWALQTSNSLRLGLEKAPQKNDPLPFDLTRAHQLYRALFGQVEDLIKGKHLLVVPSTQIPLHVLVTEKPDAAADTTDAFRRAAWLAKSNSITVLPSVSSLKALREHAKASHATKRYVGFGNPLLDGPNSNKVRAEMARARQKCPTSPWQRFPGQIAGGTKVPQQRSGLADVASIREQVALPETADELCAVARDLGVSNSDIWLGARATERDVKRLSESGELAAYRLVHFATHGALAGELQAGAEPGLILTPPGEATPEDDGYLSASEIAGLKLDADWVILSACNTAAGGAEGADALSGMARAFFYAGARSLLVSHWAVESDSTVRLITSGLPQDAVPPCCWRQVPVLRPPAHAQACVRVQTCQ